MSYTSKFNPNDNNYLKKGAFRKPLKNRISDYFQDDLALPSFNPFSQQLSPWNGSSKLQASINLLRKQVEFKQPAKHSSLEHTEPSVQRILSTDIIEYPNLIFHSSDQKLKQSISRYTCPRLKVNSQDVIVSKSSKDEARRFLFSKKPLSQNKNPKKIANLTIQWDQDIVYNPQKKYFQEQNLKRKILRKFSQTRNQNRNQNNKKQSKNQEKLFKLQFKNNKIHKKEVSVFEFKKKDFSIQLERSNSKKDWSQCNTPQLEALVQAQAINQVNQIKVSNLNFGSNNTIIKLDENEDLNGRQINKPFQSDKWKFRTSLKARRTISPQKSFLRKTQKIEQKQRKLFNEETNQKKDKQILNRMTLELNQNIKDDNFTPFHVSSKTSPPFFQKKV